MLTRSTLAQFCDLQHHLVVLFFLKADFSSGLQFPPTSEHPPLVHASTHRPMCTTGTFLQLSKKPSSPTVAPPPVENQKERLKKGAMGYYGVEAWSRRRDQGRGCEDAPSVYRRRGLVEASRRRGVEV